MRRSNWPEETKTLFLEYSSGSELCPIFKNERHACICRFLGNRNFKMCKLLLTLVKPALVLYILRSQCSVRNLFVNLHFLPTLPKSKQLVISWRFDQQEQPFPVPTLEAFYRKHQKKLTSLSIVAGDCTHVKSRFNNSLRLEYETSRSTKE